jgi:phage pi2 protein 07
MQRRKELWGGYGFGKIYISGVKLSMGTYKIKPKEVKEMKKVLWVALCLFILTGCGGYWQVVDPTTKEVYYTKKVKKERGGAVKFTDAKTGNQITLQNSEVMEVSKDQFREAVGPK